MDTPSALFENKSNAFKEQVSTRLSKTREEEGHNLSVFSANTIAEAVLLSITDIIDVLQHQPQRLIDFLELMNNEQVTLTHYMNNHVKGIQKLVDQDKQYAPLLRVALAGLRIKRFQAKDLILLNELFKRNPEVEKEWKKEPVQQDICNTSQGKRLLTFNNLGVKDTADGVQYAANECIKLTLDLLRDNELHNSCKQK